jgi:Protein of unknown function (DUF2637)
VVAGGSLRAVRNLSAGAVALIAAFSSYRHTVHVALRFAERPEVAYALPVSVDGMLVVATVVMVDDKRHGNQARPITRVAFTAGVAASLAANIAAAHPSVGARLVAAWPAVALLLVVEMLARPPATAAGNLPPPTAANRQPPPAVTRPPPPPLPPPNRRQPATPTAAPQVPPGDVSLAVPAHHLFDHISASLAAGAATSSGDSPGRDGGPPRHAAVTTVNDGPPAATGGIRGTTPRPHRADRPQPNPNATRRRRPTATTRQLAQQIIDTEPELTRTELAARLGRSTRRLREILNAQQ